MYYRVTYEKPNSRCVNSTHGIPLMDTRQRGTSLPFLPRDPSRTRTIFPVHRNLWVETTFSHLQGKEKTPRNFFTNGEIVDVDSTQKQINLTGTNVSLEYWSTDVLSLSVTFRKSTTVSVIRNKVMT